MKEKILKKSAIFMAITLLFIFVSSISASAIACTVPGLIQGKQYYIKNVATGKYLDVYYAGDTDGDDVWTYGWNGNPSQTWRIEEGTDGQIVLTPANTTGKVLTLSQEGNAEISTRYNLSSQKFTITRILTGSTGGCYTISIGNQYLADTGTTVEAISSSTSSSAAWSFRAVDKGEASYCGFYYQNWQILFFNGYFNTTENFDLFQTVMNTYHYTPRTKTNSTVSVELDRECNDTIWIFNGHGAIDDNNNYTAGIVFVDGEGEQTGSLTASMVESLPANCFASEQLVIYMGCGTAIVHDGKSLVANTYLKGAKCVIGTLNTIDVDDANDWIEAFLNSLNQGKKIEVCINDATALVPDIGTIYSIGDKNQILGLN